MPHDPVLSSQLDGINVEFLEVIDTQRADKLFGIANFYLRERRPKAARYYLQRIRKDRRTPVPAGRLATGGGSIT